MDDLVRDVGRQLARGQRVPGDAAGVEGVERRNGDLGGLLLVLLLMA